MSKKDLAFGRVNEFLKTFQPVSPDSSSSTTDDHLPRHSLPAMEISPDFKPDCPFCPIERKTPWYLSDVIHDIVVCQDLHHRQYTLRILVVGSGLRWHEPWSSLPHVYQDLFVALAEAFAAYAITKGQAKELVVIENIHSLFPGHAHIQACLM